MKLINVIILSFLLFLINTQVPQGKVVNTCGLKEYREPENSSECKEEGEICCFVKIQGNFGTKKFCVSTPSKIEKDEVKIEIKNYTSYELVELVCNKASIIKNGTIISLLIFLILF